MNRLLVNAALDEWLENEQIVSTTEINESIMKTWIDAKRHPLVIPDEGDTWEITPAGAKEFLGRLTIDGKDHIGWFYIDRATVHLFNVGEENDTGHHVTEIEYYIECPYEPLSV